VGRSFLEIRLIALFLTEAIAFTPRSLKLLGGWTMEWINVVFETLTGAKSAELKNAAMELQNQAGISLSRVTRVEWISATELVLLYPRGNFFGSVMVTNTPQIIRMYVGALKSLYPKMMVYQCRYSSRQQETFVPAEIEIENV